MILDTLAASTRYLRLHPGFPAAFDYLKSLNGQLGEGRQQLDGERLFAGIACSDGRGRAGAQLEAHRRYIDIQMCLAGQESIGWRPLATCGQPQAPFDAERDVQFYGDRPESWFELRPQWFCVFYPDDAHAPLAGEGDIWKAVVKVAVDWGAA
jgi:YhcH/YjgK/YiaL family protein